ncbi:hypothetical protein SAY86_027637 [Trapa natans]|uniref:FAD dependent oxidoreductase domain-containing protein n=1 Tax=Trapa natans TaxID=22666 RepID=A0AAN7QJ49_TRANT|nr:hypothetical protein SAY86_027637 [Trapa natans]
MLISAAESLQSACSLIVPIRRRTRPLLSFNSISSSSSPSSVRCCSSSLPLRPIRYAVLGAGFAGLSVAWHLLKHSPIDLHLTVDIFDESGIGCGASGVAGGLLHPYSPKVKLLWQGDNCWKECLKLLSIAEAAAEFRKSTPGAHEFSIGEIIHRRGILRPAMDAKSLEILTKNAESCLPSCRIESIDKEAAETLVPNIHIPFKSLFYMPEALNVHPLSYLQALFMACENLVKETSTSGSYKKELHLHKRSVNQLTDLAEEYDAVVICIGAKADFLPELAGKLPLRMCRGVIAHVQLPDHVKECYPDHSPSILSDAWLAVQGPRDLLVGSTWDWKSRNPSREVTAEEASQAVDELIPKASTIYPKIKDWTFVKARAGLRAMPPLTSQGSLPLLGSVDHLLDSNRNCRYWFFGGLGARGLLYHALLGKLMAQAVLQGDDSILPSELTSWKKIKS